jgi:hypothetical protein
MDSLRSAAPARSGSRRRRRRTTGRGSADAIVHQCPQLAHQIRPDYQSRIVTLSLQRPEDVFRGPAPPGAGELKSSLEGSYVRGRHVASSECGRVALSTLQFGPTFPVNHDVPRAALKRTPLISIR